MNADADDDALTIGRRVRQIRRSRGKSLVVVAGLAGISKSQLSRIERGETALERRSDIVAIANALRVAPSELRQRCRYPLQPTAAPMVRWMRCGLR